MEYLPIIANLEGVPGFSPLSNHVGKRLMGISNVKSPIWALLQHPKPLQKLDYKVQIL